MDCTPFIAPSPALRRDGWSPELKIRFLDHLAVKGTVRSACSLVGLSREAAYRLRRRDPLFARGWNAALALARENGTDVLACHALDGIEEHVWYRGEHVGTRIRHDARLLLAHLARLDRLVAENPAGEDAGRFDELLALIGGEEMPEELAETGTLPPARPAFISETREWVEREHRLDREAQQPDLNAEEHAAIEQESAEIAEETALEAAAQWDEWFRRACVRVDEVLGAPEFSPRTVSTVSTSGPDAPSPTSASDPSTSSGSQACVSSPAG